MKKICVVGSLNVDLTITVPRFHLPGESMIGTSFATYTGGKGGNQAVACARLGAEVNMVGCLGDDGNGEFYLNSLKAEGIPTDGIVVKEGVNTGMAIIEVDPSGDNRIIVVIGANDELDLDAITAKKDYISQSDICLFQCENPLPSINHAMAIARQSGAVIILDPAPAPSSPLPEAILALCDYVTPNETELMALTGMPVDTVEQAVEAAGKLLDKGAKAVINKRGSEGALFVSADGYKMYPGFKVEAVDTTAAGDSFNAGLAIGLSLGYGIDEAIILANAVGALSTLKKGAKAGMPTLDEAQRFIALQG
ncbi:MAG: ribokinase [Clostridia bacterium]|nr:ribokinase [Clostridia bacterium]